MSSYKTVCLASWAVQIESLCGNAVAYTFRFSTYKLLKRHQRFRRHLAMAMAKLYFCISLDYLASVSQSAKKCRILCLQRNHMDHSSTSSFPISWSFCQQNSLSSRGLSCHWEKIKRLTGKHIFTFTWREYWYSQNQNWECFSISISINICTDNLNCHSRINM